MTNISNSPSEASIARKRLEEAQTADQKIAAQEKINGEISATVESPLRPTPPPREQKREYKQAVLVLAERIVGDVLEKALKTPR